MARLIRVPPALKPLAYFPPVYLPRLVAIDRKWVSQHAKLIITYKPKQITAVLVSPENPVLLVHNRFHYHGVESATIPLYGTKIRNIRTYIECFPFVSKALI
jgi:hypothetical protein